MPRTSLAVPRGPARDEFSDLSTDVLWNLVNDNKACADRDPASFWTLTEGRPADAKSRTQELALARGLCTDPRTGAVCPVLSQCLALENRVAPGSERYGVLGGMPSWERKRRLRLRRAV